MLRLQKRGPPLGWSTALSESVNDARGSQSDYAGAYRVSTIQIKGLGKCRSASNVPKSLAPRSHESIHLYAAGQRSRSEALDCG
jgi:hypothetical protein